MKIVVAAVAAVVGIGLATPQWQRLFAAPAEAPPGAVVIVFKAIIECFTDTVRATGYVVPSKTAVANVDSDGYRVTEVLVTEGDQVTAGQTLARLARAPDTTSPGGAPGAAGAGAQRPPANIALRAPAAGLVMRSTAMVGAPASPQTDPLFVIVIDNQIEVELEVPSIHVPKLKFGEAARVEIDTGPERSGRVRLVGVEVDPKTQFSRVRLSISSDPSLRIGMFARATISASNSCGVAIPRSAVDYRTEGATVQIVRGRTVAARRITVGLVSDDNVEVREGLRRR